MAKSANSTSRFIEELTAVDRLTHADRIAARRAQREVNKVDCCRAVADAYLAYHRLAAAAWEGGSDRVVGVSVPIEAKNHRDKILRLRGDKFLAAMDAWSHAANRLNKSEERDFLAALKRFGHADYWDPAFHERYKERKAAWLERHAAVAN